MQRGQYHGVRGFLVYAKVRRSRILERMTKDKFKTLCDEVLVPRISKLMHGQLTDMAETLEIVGEELRRIGDRLDEMAAADEDDR